MFTYIRYISIISLLAVSAIAFFTGSYFRSSAIESMIIEPTTSKNSKSTKYIFEEFICNNLSVLKNEEKTNFIRNSNLLFRTINAIKINLYYNYQNILTTNESDLIFFNDFDDNIKNINKAEIHSLGYYSPDLIKKTSIRNILNFNSKDCPNSELVNNDNITIEIFSDVTKNWNYLFKLQIITTTGIISVFILLYLLLFLSSRRAEKIISKQHEDNIQLEKEKTAAEIKSKEKSMFLANVTHELRTPLNAIIGFSEIIKNETNGKLDNEEYEQYIVDINSSGNHLLSLINDILDFSKAEASKLELDSIEADISKISETCLRTVKTRADEANVKLINEIPKTHYLLKLDPKRIKQVILNLLSNSVKFTPENGSVTLSIEENGDNIIITVKDTGIGIAPKNLSKVMSPFGQIDSSLSKRYEGTGLGLPLSKKLTEIMGGKFSIESEEGLGTKISLKFTKVVIK